VPRCRHANEVAPGRSCIRTSLRLASPPSSFRLPNQIPISAASLARTYELIGILQRVPTFFVRTSYSVRSPWSNHTHVRGLLNAKDPSSFLPIIHDSIAGIPTLAISLKFRGAFSAVSISLKQCLLYTHASLWSQYRSKCHRKPANCCKPETAPRHFPPTTAGRYPPKSVTRRHRSRKIRERMRERSTRSGRGPPRGNWPSKASAGFLSEEVSSRLSYEGIPRAFTEALPSHARWRR
jgi:hypothetical protein